MPKRKRSKSSNLDLIYKKLKRLEEQVREEKHRGPRRARVIESSSSSAAPSRESSPVQRSIEDGYSYSDDRAASIDKELLETLDIPEPTPVETAPPSPHAEVARAAASSAAAPPGPPPATDQPAVAAAASAATAAPAATPAAAAPHPPDATSAPQSDVLDLDPLDTLDPETLEILGDDPTAKVEYGAPIHREIANRFEHFALTGLDKEIRKDLAGKYLVPENCVRTGAPILNDEIRAALPETIIRRDKILVTKQKQLSTVISCVASTITEQLSSKTKDHNLIKKLMDMGRLLCDIQHTESISRRQFHLYSLKKDMNAHLVNTKIDKYLFGENLSDTLKTAKAVNKFGSDLNVGSKHPKKTEPHGGKQQQSKKLEAPGPSSAPAAAAAAAEEPRYLPARAARRRVEAVAAAAADDPPPIDPSSQNRLLIKNGRVVNDDGMEDADVYIEDGIIKQLGRNLIIPGGTRVIDATGKLVMPGGVDPHTHFELEAMGATSADDFYKGTRAAVAGGTTTVIDFVIPNKGQSLLEAYNNWREKADGKVCCDYALHVAVTWWSPSVQKEMQLLSTEEYGVNSFKMFMAYKGAFMIDDYDLYRAMETCYELKALPLVHAENGDIIARNTEKLLAAGITGPEGHQLSRDEEVEAEAVNRACVIANQAGCPLYIVHMMSRAALEALRRARHGRRYPVYGETLAATVGTDGSHHRNSCFRHAAGHVMAPPLRPDPDTPQAVAEALADDHLQLIGSDNCTFVEKDKELGKGNFSKIPCGVNGVEDRLAVLWQKAVNTGLMDPCRFVAVTSTNAARIFNLYPAKGRIEAGADADVVVWDPRLERTITAAKHHHAVDFNIFEGMHVVGSPQYVVVSGRVCFDDGNLRVVEGHGRFLKTPTNCPYVFGGDAPAEAAQAPAKQLTLKVTNGTTPTELSVVSKQVESMSVSGCSTPTGRKMREPGQRDLQNSTFSLSKEVEGLDTKTSVRVRNPPGGKSSGLW